MYKVYKFFDDRDEGVDGISKEAIYYVMRSVGEKLTREEVEDMFKEAHKDENGQITYDEFLKIMNEQN